MEEEKKIDGMYFLIWIVGTGLGLIFWFVMAIHNALTNINITLSHIQKTLTLIAQ